MRLILTLFLFAVAGFAQNPLTASFPPTVATDTVLGVACNGARTNLTSSITNSTSDLAFTIPIGDASKICTPSFAVIEQEVVKLCSKASNTISVCSGGRAVHGGIASHEIGAPMVVYFDENYLNQTNAEVKAIQTALGANLINILTRSRDFLFGSDGTYDIGDNAGTGRPRDGYLSRDLTIGRDLYVGNWRIRGQSPTTITGNTTLDWSTHSGQVVVGNSGSNMTITVPAGLGLFSATFIQMGTGQMIFSAGVGVSIFNPHSLTRTFGQGSPATLICGLVGSNQCTLMGDLAQ